MIPPLVFISYSHKDAKFVNQLVKDLEHNDLKIWQDKKKIAAGDEIYEEIEKGLNLADFFIIVISNNSKESYNVKIELSRAVKLEQKKGQPQIIPIRIDDTEPPFLIAEKQYIDFINYKAGRDELLKKFQPLLSPTLRVGGGTGTGHYLMEEIVLKFREKYPNIPIPKSEAVSEDLVNSIVNDELDFAIIGKEPESKVKQFLEYQKIGDVLSVLIVPPNFPFRKKAISEKELLSLLDNEKFIGRPQGSGTYKANLNYLEPRLGKEKAEHLLQRNVVDDIKTVRDWVAKGKGISIVPDIIVTNYVSSGRLRAVKLPEDANRPFYAVWALAKKHKRSQIKEEFIKLLKTVKVQNSNIVFTSA